MDPMAAAELRRLGGDPDGFRSRQLSGVDCDAADLILAVAAEHRTYVLREEPRLLKRTFTLLEFAHLVSEVELVRKAQGDPVRLVGEASTARGASRLEEYDVRDPFGQSPEVHRQVADTIHGAVMDIARALSGFEADSD
jgi:protein-tyrosine phosphatase